MQITFDPNSIDDCNTVVSIMDHLSPAANQPTAPAAGAPPVVLPVQTVPHPQAAPPQPAPPQPAPPQAQPPQGPPQVADDPLPNPANVRTPSDLAPEGGTIPYDSFKDRVSTVLAKVGPVPVQAAVKVFGFTKLSEVPEGKYLEVLASVEALGVTQ